MKKHVFEKVSLERAKEHRDKGSSPCGSRVFGSAPCFVQSLPLQLFAAAMVGAQIWWLVL